MKALAHGTPAVALTDGAGFHEGARAPPRSNVSRSPLNGFAAALSAHIGARSLGRTSLAAIPVPFMKYPG